LVQGAQQYIKNLNNTKQFDQKENNEIIDNARYFEQLSLPRDQLVNNIPRREALAQRELPEEREVRSEILKLYELSDKCMNIIKPIFAELNDDSAIVGYFIEVLAKKTTEQAIYERFKETYETKLNDLKKLSEEVKSQKDVVNNVVQRDSEAIRAKQQPNIHNEAMDYFRMLDQYANMYLNKYEKLMKGDKYYNDLYQKITNLVKLGNDWMIKRSNEKNVLLSTFGGPNRQGRDQGRYLTQSTMEDPFRNPYTTQFGSHLTNNHYGNQGNKGGQ
jgi:hypothetical protein